MDALINAMMDFSDFIWTYPMPILLVVLGIYLSIQL